MRILLPIDGSELSLRAVAHVAQFVKKGQVVLFHVTGIPPRMLEHRGGNTDREEDQLEHQVGEQSRRYDEEAKRAADREIFAPAEQLLRGDPGADLQVSRRLVTEASSVPALAILSEARTNRYDAVVIGRHGHSGVLSLFMGGTAAKLVHHLSDTPIWLVP